MKSQKMGKKKGDTKSGDDKNNTLTPIKTPDHAFAALAHAHIIQTDATFA
jgi:hypothetical protein